ncbi:Dolichyl-diphosphooligosaccharide--protein glycosyltransferase subunit WBP1 [Spinellus fusiger]|nr:Dolichyl-diphosphooligosaccharide--protein glycosyltransferase subunit WBP1 [Spinellus fusiger]
MKSLISLTALVLSTLTVFVSVAESKSVSGNNVLVLLDSTAHRNAYSRLWQTLYDRDFKLSFISASEENIPLYYFGEPIYQHILHFAPTTGSSATHKHINTIELVKFVNKGGNLLVAASKDVKQTVRDVASEFDIEFDPAGKHVFDTTAYNVSSEHDIILTSQVVAPHSIIPKDLGAAPIVYSGIGLTVGQVPLVNRVLSSEKSAFVAKQYTKGVSDVDTVDLVGAFQARNSARATFVGSLDLFSDKFFDAPVKRKQSNGDVVKFKKSGNEAFVTELIKWTFQEKSVLKVIDHRHHKANHTEQPSYYRIKDDMVYALEISEYVDDHWVPFKADDIQLEFIMLDPYIRTTLKQVPVGPQHHYGRFKAHVQLPDVYGVFTFRVNYKRAGFTYVLAEDVVAIRPFRHDEYPRFLTAAYPYYTSVGSMVVGFLVFSAVWLSTWGGRALEKTEKTKKN